jgi:hypothetical protein
MAKSEAVMKSKGRRLSNPGGKARAGRKGATPAKRKGESASEYPASDLHYCLIAKDGTLTIVSRETGLATTIAGDDAKVFASLVADRQALAKKLGQALVDRGFNGGNWELIIFIESNQ